MPIFFIKSLLSVIIILLSLIAMFTMFEVFGKNEKKYDIEKLNKIHRANGIFYFLVFIVIAYFCLNFVINTKTELSPRASFHALFALTVLVLLGLKISFVRIYRQFYNQVKTIGLLIALITFGMMGTSGGYYLIVTEFGTDQRVAKMLESEKQGEPMKEANKIAVRTDTASIAKGKEMYESKCYFCHDAYSNDVIVGPGHKGILKNRLLPVSKKPATPENVVNQIRNPYRDMPSFSYLSDDEVLNLVAFLNTL